MVLEYQPVKIFQKVISFWKILTGWYSKTIAYTKLSDIVGFYSTKDYRMVGRTQNKNSSKMKHQKEHKLKGTNDKSSTSI